MALEDRIKEARKRAGLTQEQAAHCIGVAKSTWAGYEIGNSQPDIAKLVKIMEALNVDANYLWQDYITQKNSPAPEGAEERISMEQSDRLFDALVQAGIIPDSISFTEDDRAFLQHIIGLLDVWSSRERK